MSVKIAIASGKGGTGKTTVSLNLYAQLANKAKDVALVDCDVEEPNGGLFFSEKVCRYEKEVNQMVPFIDESKCLFCGKCQDWCEFNAIVILPSKKYAKVDDALCHSCGACLMACKEHAIKEIPNKIGDVKVYDTAFGAGLYEGRLKVGSPMQTMMIKALKDEVPDDKEILLFDAPPGTSCQVVATVSDSDYVVLVTEPTPFGLHDLKLMVELLRELNKPFGVVVNKSGIGDAKVYDYLNKEGIRLLSKIPFNESFAYDYAKGDFFDNQPSDVLHGFKQLIDNLDKELPCEKLQF